MFKNERKDVRLLWLCIWLRLFGYGMTNQMLTLFLEAVGMNDAQIGLFMTLTLIGDVALSYVLTWFADQLGRRRVLIAGAISMVISGTVFSYSQQHLVLLICAIIGVISPSSDEVGPFKSVEEVILAHLVVDARERVDVYGVHAFLGSFGAALGAVSCGAVLETLKWVLGKNISDLDSYRFIFYIYTALALLHLLVVLQLSDKVELYQQNQEEMEPLLPRTKKRNLRRQTIITIIKLLLVYGLDSFGSGFMTSAWTVYYYSTVFSMGALALGSVFFITQLLSAYSNIPSAVVTKRIGPIRTTLLFQIPSAIFSILIPFAEGNLGISLVLLNIFSLTTNMDVTPRRLFLTSIIPPEELSRVMGIVNLGKTFARCLGPLFTGILAEAGYLWVCFIISGLLVIVADLILAAFYYGIDDEVLEKNNT